MQALVEKQKATEKALVKSSYLGSMPGIKDNVGRKYYRMEVAFLVFLFYLIPIMSSIEFSFYERGNAWLFIQELEYRLVTGTYSFLFYSVFYWGFVRRYVFARKTALLLGCMLVAIPLNHLYDKYIMDWSMSRMSFLSEHIQAEALQSLNRENFLFVVTYTLIREILMVIGFAFVVRSLRQDEQVKALKEQQLSTELSYLKAQLQPHFFFNTLNNIYGLALKQSGDTAPVVAKLSEMMRYILYESDRPRVPLEQEITFLRHYVEIEKLRHSVLQIRISFDVQGITRQHQLAPLVLLPFVENAFKHGIQDEVKTGFVAVVIHMAGKELTLQVSNSKPVPGQVKEQQGLGLQNAGKRLALLYAGKHQLDITENSSTYQATLTLDLT